MCGGESLYRTVVWVVWLPWTFVVLKEQRSGDWEGKSSRLVLEVLEVLRVSKRKGRCSLEGTMQL